MGIYLGIYAAFMAVIGVNVMAVLVTGILLSGVVGVFTGTYGVFDWFGAMGKGITDMGELIIITMMTASLGKGCIFSAIPVADPDYKVQRIPLKGEITSPINPKPVCRFANRCEYCTEVCTSQEPQLIEVEPQHFVACHKVNAEMGQGQ